MIRDFLFPNRFTGTHMLAVMCLFFGTIITVNMTLAYFAAGSWTGLIVKNTYVESQIFDQKKAARAEQLALGWTYNFTYTDGKFSAQLADNAGLAIKAERVEAKFERIIHENEDQLVLLSPGASGDFFADIQLAPGQWRVDVNVYDAGQLLWTMPARLHVQEVR